MIHKPKDGVRINNLTQGVEQHLTGYSYQVSPGADEVFVLCPSRSNKPALWKKFGATACVEVIKVQPFMARLTSSLPQGATPILCRANYRAMADKVGIDLAFSEKVASSKSRAIFAEEEETRILFSLTNALATENLQHALVHQDHLPGCIPHAKNALNLVIGNIEDLCRLIVPG